MSSAKPGAPKLDSSIAFGAAQSVRGATFGADSRHSGRFALWAESA